eukprot:m.870685 g.870685  ORF g.870685 m.870685 type:complete len:314 (+) comp23567_c0_seq17:257-1198(+)
MEKIKGIKNARFVGECVKSVNLRKECFIRSGSPSDVTDEDVNVLVDELQLKTIVDLRSDRELKLFGNDRGKLINRARKHGGASTLNYESFPKMITTMNYLKLIRSNLSWGEMGTIVPYSMLGVVKRSFWSVERGSMGIAMDAVGRGGLLGLYRAIWDYTPGSSESAKTGWDLCRVLRLCATAKRQPCLIHCTAGKDRTGVVCALLLAAVDVDRKEIVADYHASHVVVPPDCKDAHNVSFNADEKSASHFDKMLGPAGKEKLKPLRGAPAEVMEAMLDEIVAKHGSLHQYLDHIGFDAKWRAKLKGSWVATAKM